MLRPSIRMQLCLVLVVVLSGCLGGVGPSETEPTEETPEPYPGCTNLYPDTDPATFQCPISEYPPDIHYINRGTEQHTLSTRITRANGSTVFSEAVTLYAYSTDLSSSGSWDDVIDSPGEYTIHATIDNSTTETAQWNVSEQYLGIGLTEWIIQITETGELEVYKPQSA